MRDTLDHTMLGPVQLSPHLRLRGLVAPVPVVYQSSRTIDGLTRHYPFRLIAGLSIELDGDGWHFEIGQFKQVEALISTGQPVLLQHHVHTGMVLITAITIDGLAIDYADYTDTDWVSAKISMLTL